MLSVCYSSLCFYYTTLPIYPGIFPHRNLPLSFKPASNHFCRIPNLLSPPPLSLLALLSTWTPPSFTSSLYQFYHISSHPPQENLSLSHTHSPPPPHPSPCAPVSGHQGGRFITATWLQTLPCTRTYTHIYTYTHQLNITNLTKINKTLKRT